MPRNMAHFEHAEFGASFDLPDDPTVKEVLAYDSKRLELSNEPPLVVLWECIRPVIQNWQCESLPDYQKSLDEIHGRKAAAIIEWAAFRGSEWRLMLDETPKN